MLYPAKVLLFGEYTILFGSRALARPFSRFGARWLQGLTPDPRLLDLSSYLERTFDPDDFDLERMESELQQGWQLQSGIPTGYGLGSSGAVCAAVFDRYAAAGPRELPAEQLKSFFARMESHFHGSSSGTDPLIIHLNCPVLLQPDGCFQRVTLPPLPELRFLLFDTGLSRQTGPLVDRFRQRMQEEHAFAHAVKQEWIPATEAAIDATLTGDAPALREAFDRISRFQQQEMADFIPDMAARTWSADNHRLKLCGAGGGGMMLGLLEFRPVGNTDR